MAPTCTPAIGRASRSTRGRNGTSWPSTRSLEIRVGPKTFVGIRGARVTIDFDSAATFDGVSLQQALNRTVTGGAVTLRYQITPLTALTFDVGRSEDRFEFSPERDSDSTSAVVGVKLDQFALIKGKASVGYRDFQPISPALPAYKGVIANADLSYVAFGTTQLAVQAIRDVQYSFDIDEPYYLLTGVLGLADEADRPANRRRRAHRRAEARLPGQRRRGRRGARQDRPRPDLRRRHRLSHGKRHSHRVQRRSATEDLARGERELPRLSGMEHR